LHLAISSRSAPQRYLLFTPTLSTFHLLQLVTLHAFRTASRSGVYVLRSTHVSWRKRHPGDTLTDCMLVFCSFVVAMASGAVIGSALGLGIQLYANAVRRCSLYIERVHCMLTVNEAGSDCLMIGASRSQNAKFTAQHPKRREDMS
jgi:hypothetical protein